ncbi:MAG: hypothetical protein ACK456_02185 [Pseudanabaenaceae cyanobacterium]|jgi:hypothetical protein
MKTLRFGLTSFALGFSTLVSCVIVPSFLGKSAAVALPGQPAYQVQEWLRGHPVLRPAKNETLLITKQNSPAHRFQFLATGFMPFNGSFLEDGRGDVIRSEKLEITDVRDGSMGVTPQRLEDALRGIYGAEIMQDFVNGEVLVFYPSRSDGTGGSVGQLRQGKRFLYWIEVLQAPGGNFPTGQITVLDLRDVAGVTTELRRRRPNVVLKSN